MDKDKPTALIAKADIDISSCQRLASALTTLRHADLTTKLLCLVASDPAAVLSQNWLGGSQKLAASLSPARAHEPVRAGRRLTTTIHGALVADDIALPFP